MTTLLITGANRGLGLEHTQQALSAGENVIATCRAPESAEALQLLLKKHPDQLSIEQLDVSNHESIELLAQRLNGRAIDTLFNIAGLYGGGWANESDRAKQSLLGMDYAQWMDILQTNVIGCFKLTAELLANLDVSERKQVVMMSSDLGSIANNGLGMSHAYRSSKAALNMLTKGLAIELADKHIAVISLAPGWVKTDLGGDNAEWDVDVSVQHQREVMATLNLSQSGQFINLLGEQVAW